MKTHYNAFTMCIFKKACENDLSTSQPEKKVFVCFITLKNCFYKVQKSETKVKNSFNKK